MKYYNEMTMNILSLSENENFARVCVACFISSINPNIEEIDDIKTCVSEAVTNCVVHAYPEDLGEIVINVKIINNLIKISVKDFGIGIEDINKVRQPFFTSKPDAERSGMGITIMESFMDNVEINSKLNKGVEVIMSKRISIQSED